MTKPRTVASLFEEEPMHWGLRGDPHLWREMRGYFEQTPLPGTSDELITLIDNAFQSLTAHSMSELEMFFVERFHHGGMSGGHIAPEFWREEVVPMMCARYLQMKNPKNE
jgi:hypothetical protein